MNYHNHREYRIENPESSIQNRISSIENPTLAHIRHFSSLFTNLPAYKALHLSRVLYKSATFYAKQTQNKPNFKRDDGFSAYYRNFKEY